MLMVFTLLYGSPKSRSPSGTGIIIQCPFCGSEQMPGVPQSVNTSRAQCMKYSCVAARIVMVMKTEDKYHVNRQAPQRRSIT